MGWIEISQEENWSSDFEDCLVQRKAWYGYSIEILDGKIVALVVQDLVGAQKHCLVSRQSCKDLLIEVIDAGIPRGEDGPFLEIFSAEVLSRAESVDSWINSIDEFINTAF